MSAVFSKEDISLMTLALEEAEKATLHQDVPVGAVVFHEPTGKILAIGHNTKEVNTTAIGHAEINVIREACSKLESWRLSECTLYVTLEPCPMCTGAILASRIPRVVCGAKDPVAGAMGSVWALHEHPTATQHTQIEYGCMENESKAILQKFFREKR